MFPDVDERRRSRSPRHQPRKNTYETVKAVENYLRAFPLDYRVSEIPPGADGVDHFLFESRRGYFDYHASAMVVMLRTLGIPSRLAVGYVIDETDFDAERGAYSVRDRNSYSWAEVYFPEHGWIAFNPSPDKPAELRPAAPVDPAATEPAQRRLTDRRNFP